MIVQSRTSKDGSVGTEVEAVLKDPFCGMKVKPDSPHDATHEGQAYYFCSAGCKTKFVASPAKYLGPKTAPEEVSLSAPSGVSAHTV